VTKNMRLSGAAAVAMVIAVQDMLARSLRRGRRISRGQARVSPRRFARQKSSLPTPRAADGHPT